MDTGVRLGIEYGTTGLTALLAFPDGRAHRLLFNGATRMTSSVAIARRGHLVAGPTAERVCLQYPERYLPTPSLTAFAHGRVIGRRTISVRDVATATLSPIWRAATTVIPRRSIRNVAIAVPMPLYSCDQLLADVAADMRMPRPYLTSTTEALAELTIGETTGVTDERFIVVTRIDGGGALEASIIRLCQDEVVGHSAIVVDREAKLVNPTAIESLLRRGLVLLQQADASRLTAMVCQVPEWSHPMVRAALSAVLPAHVRVVFADEFAAANGAVVAHRRHDANCRSIRRPR